MLDQVEEEINNTFIEENEPESNQLEEANEDLDLDSSTDNYEPEKLDEETKDDDSNDLISEMEKLLNVGSNKQEKK